MATPKVSVVIPTYNRAQILARAVESVLSQTFLDWELLVVDNGSTDGTEEVISQFEKKDKRIRSLGESKKGASAARNRGIGEARGEWVAFLDDDDEWLPEKLSHQIAFVATHPGIGLLYSQSYVKDAEGKVVGRKPSGKAALDFMELVERNTIPLLTVLVRRRCLEEVGRFVETLKGVAEDYNLWLRVAKEFRIGYLPEPLAVYHVHGGNLSTQPLRRYQGYEAALFTFSQLLKECHDPEQIRLIERRLALLHYFFARQQIFRNRLSEARDHLKASRALMRRHDFDGKGRFFLKSLILSWLLLGGEATTRFLRRRWQRREVNHFIPSKEGGLP